MLIKARSVETAAEREIEIDAGVETLAPDREQAALGVEGAALRFEQGNEVGQTPGVALFREGAGGAGFCRRGGQGLLLVGEDCFGAQSGLDLAVGSQRALGVGEERQVLG